MHFCAQFVSVNLVKYVCPSVVVSKSLCNMHYHCTHKHNMEWGGIVGGVGVNDYICMLYVQVWEGPSGGYGYERGCRGRVLFTRLRPLQKR